MACRLHVLPRRRLVAGDLPSGTCETAWLGKIRELCNGAVAESVVNSRQLLGASLVELAARRYVFLSERGARQMSDHSTRRIEATTLGGLLQPSCRS